MSATAYAGTTYAVVTGTRVNVRSDAKICASNRLFQVDRDAIVEIHGVIGDFFQATVSGTPDVFISREFTRITKTFGTINAPFIWVYDFPCEDSEILAMLSSNAVLTVTSEYEDWYGIIFDGSLAFVEKANVDIPRFAETLPRARIGGTLADEIVDNAFNYIGTRYRWGGTTPAGFDCSGFMVYLFTPHGITLNRSSRDQARNGVAVARDELTRGDLVFFGSGTSVNHAGLYIGDGQFIHSSTERSGGVIVSNLSDAHNSRAYVTARRVIL